MVGNVESAYCPIIVGQDQIQGVVKCGRGVGRGSATVTPNKVSMFRYSGAFGVIWKVQAGSGGNVFRGAESPLIGHAGVVRVLMVIGLVVEDPFLRWQIKPVPTRWCWCGPRAQGEAELLLGGLHSEEAGTEGCVP